MIASSSRQTCSPMSRLQIFWTAFRDLLSTTERSSNSVQHGRLNRWKEADGKKVMRDRTSGRACSVSAFTSKRSPWVFYHPPRSVPVSLSSALDNTANQDLTQFLSEVATVSISRFLTLNTMNFSREALRLLAQYKAFRAARNIGISGPWIDAKDYRALVAILMRGKVAPQEISAIMEDMVNDGVRLDSQDWGRLITAYSRAGDLQLAVETLTNMLDWRELRPDSSCFNGVIEAYAEIPDPANARKYWEMMRTHGCKPTHLTYLMMVDAYTRAGDIKGAKPYWDHICRTLGMSKEAAGEDRPVNITYRAIMQTYHGLIQRACSRGQLTQAMKFYNGMVARGHMPVLATYTYLLEGFLQRQDPKGARMIYERMVYMRVKPDLFVYSMLIDVHGKVGDLEQATRFLRLASEDGLQPDVTLYNILINAYGIAKDMKGIQSCFDSMVENRLEPDRWTYATIINAHMKAGDPNGAYRWLSAAGKYFSNTSELTKKHRTSRNFGADSVIFASLIEGHCQMGDLDRAKLLMTEVERAGIPPLPSNYTSLICAHLRIHDVDGAVAWFEAMKAASVEPDSQIYGIMIAAFSRRGDHARARALMDAMTDMNVRPTSLTGGILIHAWLAAKDVAGAVNDYQRLTEMGAEVSALTLAKLIPALATECIHAVHSQNNHENLLMLFADYRRTITRTSEPPAEEVYVLLIRYMLSKQLLVEAKGVVLKMLQDGCANPRRALLLLAHHLLHQDWTALTSWTADIHTWLTATKRQQYAYRADNDGSMKSIWADGLLEDEDNNGNAARKVVDHAYFSTITKTLNAVEAFTYGNYLMEHHAARLDSASRSILKQFAADVQLDDSFVDDEQVTAYWQAVLALRRNIWKSTSSDSSGQDTAGINTLATGPLLKTLSTPEPSTPAPPKSPTPIPSFLLAAPFPDDPGVAETECSIQDLLSYLNSESPSFQQPKALRRIPEDPHFGNSDPDPPFVRFCYALLKHCEAHHLWIARRIIVRALRIQGWNAMTYEERFGPPMQEDADSVASVDVESSGVEQA
ncbi:hypothetical protein DFJ77DRAFT_452139 [Powellomyces hirtus]|nr:hypothetical protein DFJ77DRAFT_452139 [Powellomyces hirtus]